MQFSSYFLDAGIYFYYSVGQKMSVTLIPYRPCQICEKTEVQHQATVVDACGTQMEPKPFSVVRHESNSTSLNVWKIFHLTAKLYSLHSHCRNEHLVPREGHTDLWDWGLGGAKVSASDPKQDAADRES